MSKDKPGRERRKPKTERVPLANGGELRITGLRLGKGQRADLAEAAQQLAEKARQS